LGLLADRYRVYARLKAAEAERDRLGEALREIVACDSWATASVVEIARAALAEK